jgi:hypothetical protein
LETQVMTTTFLHLLVFLTKLKQRHKYPCLMEKIMLNPWIVG